MPETNWQLTPKLNFNYGIRYDYQGPLHNGNKDMSVFRPALTTTNGLAFQGVQVSSLYPQYYKNFSPRLGFSYSPEPNTVVRASFGFYFDTPNLNPFLDNRPGNAAPNGVEGNPGGPNPVYTVAPVAGAEGLIVKNVPIFPTTTSYPCSPTSTCGVFSVAPNFRSSYNENYSLNVEHTLSPSVIVQVAYVGSEGRRLLALLDINQGTTQESRPTANSMSSIARTATSIRLKASAPQTTTHSNPRSVCRTSMVSPVRSFTPGVTAWTKYPPIAVLCLKTTTTSKVTTATPTSIPATASALSSPIKSPVLHI